jgi:hypothetical protein
MTQLSKINNRYTFSAIPDKIKKELAVIKFDVDEYVKEIEKYKKVRPSNQYYYDYDLELDFSENPNISFDIGDRWYYYKAYHYQKLGLFLRKDAPPFKISLSHLSQEMVYELSQLDKKDRKFVLKQAIGQIFEDINLDLYHDSISANLEVVLTK